MWLVNDIRIIAKYLSSRVDFVVVRLGSPQDPQKQWLNTIGDIAQCSSQ